MAADVAQFEVSIDKVYKTMSTQDMQLDNKQLRGLADRSARQYIEQQFQQQLQRARAAFLQEFRNHSVVVDSEVKKIREELTEKLEAKYGERISQLKAEGADAAATISKLRDEIAQLRTLVCSQESYLAAVRHRWGLENRDRLRAEIAQLREELESAKQEITDLTHQLVCRDELVATLKHDLGGMDGQLKVQATHFSEEVQKHEELVRSLKQEMQAQQDQFAAHLQSYEEQFQEYRTKTAAELQIQDILSSRRAEALAAMEEERQLHIKARTKPTPRIGEEEPDLEAKCAPYDLETAPYRVDDMGMDTAWRDYEIPGPQFPQPASKRAQPRYRMEQLRKSAQRARVGLPAPVATETPRDPVRPSPRMREILLPELPQGAA